MEVTGQPPGSHLLIVPDVGHSVLGADFTGCAHNALQAMFAGKPIKRCGATPTPPLLRPAWGGMLAVVRNVPVCCVAAGPGLPYRPLPFEIAVSPRSIVSVTAKVALNAGSSKHGKARRASVDSNWVTAYFRSVVLLM